MCAPRRLEERFGDDCDQLPHGGMREKDRRDALEERLTGYGEKELRPASSHPRPIPRAREDDGEIAARGDAHRT